MIHFLRTIKGYVSHVIRRLLNFLLNHFLVLERMTFSFIYIVVMYHFSSLVFIYNELLNGHTDVILQHVTLYRTLAKYILHG